MINTSTNNSIFLIDFDGKYLTFRSSYNPKQLQKEMVTVDKGTVYTNLYYFDVKFLDKFIKENSL